MATNYSGRWGMSASGSKRTTRSSGSRPAPGYQTVWQTVNQKINSYKYLNAQAMGPAKFSRPSPATLNTFTRWIEKGAIVQRVSAAQLKRWAHTSQAPKSAATAKSVMARRFGKSVIKAVAPNKTGGFLVATSATWHGRNFKFPS